MTGEIGAASVGKRATRPDRDTPGYGPAATRPSPRYRVYDHVLNHCAESSIVQFDVHTPKDAGSNASRDTGLHLEILVSRNDEESLIREAITW